MKEREELLIPTPEIASEVEALEKAMSSEEDLEKYKVLCERMNEITSRYSIYNHIFEENGKVGLKDIGGNILIPAMYSEINECFDYFIRHMPVSAKNEKCKYGIVAADGSGKPLSAFEYDYASHIPWSNSYAARKGDKIAILNIKGEIIVEPIADSYCECMNGIIVFKSNGKYGLVTEYGTYVEPIYDEIDDNDDAVYVTLGDKHGYIDENGNFVDENDQETLDESTILYWIEN